MIRTKGKTAAASRARGLWACGMLVALLGCTPPTAESVTKQYAGLLGKVADRLEAVHSQSDADQAAVDIQALLKDSDAIAKAARSADASGKVSEEVKQLAKDASARLAASAERVNQQGLMTFSLNQAMQQVGLSFEAVASAVATGKLAPSESPLDEAWIEYIQTYDKQADQLAKITDVAAAEAAIDDLVAIERERHAALSKIADLKGQAPPSGIPKKYRQHYQAAQARLNEQDGTVSSRLSGDVGRLHELLQAAKNADPALQAQPFAPGAGAPRDPNMVTVTIANGQGLSPEQRQALVSRLKRLSRAVIANDISENDGTLHVDLMPVMQFDQFTQNIDLGVVSNRDDEMKSLVLTVDLEKLAAAMPRTTDTRGRPGFGPPGPDGQPGFAPPGFGPRPFGAPGGPRGVGGPGAGSLPNHIEQARQLFYSRNGGAERCVMLILENAPSSKTPEGKALLATIRDISGSKSTADLQFKQRIILLAPVDDVAALAAKINFGTVTSTDLEKREITIDVGLASTPN